MSWIEAWRDNLGSTLMVALMSLIYQRVRSAPGETVRLLTAASEQCAVPVNLERADEWFADLQTEAAIAGGDHAALANSVGSVCEPGTGADSRLALAAAIMDCLGEIDFTTRSLLAVQGSSARVEAAVKDNSEALEAVLWAIDAVLYDTEALRSGGGVVSDVVSDDRLLAMYVDHMRFRAETVPRYWGRVGLRARMYANGFGLGQLFLPCAPTRGNLARLAGKIERIGRNQSGRGRGRRRKSGSASSLGRTVVSSVGSATAPRLTSARFAGGTWWLEQLAGC